MEIYVPGQNPEPSPTAMRDALLRREYLKTLRSEASYSGRIVVPGDAQFPGYDGWLKDVLCMRLPTQLPGAWGFGQRGYGITPDMGSAAPAAPPVAGYIVWLNSQQGLYTDVAKTIPAVNDGDTIGAWADFSGFSHDGIQSTSGRRPALKLSILNGLPIIRFANSRNDTLSAGAFTFAQPGDFFIVFNPTSFTSTRTIVGGHNAGATFAAYQQGTSPNVQMYAGSIVGPITTISTGAFVILQATINGASSKLKRNADTAVTGDAGANAIAGFDLGTVTGSAGGNADMDVAEVIVYPSALSTGDSTSVRNYLNTRYSVF